MDLPCLLSPGQDIVPKIEEQLLPILLQNNYCLTVEKIKQLNGYDDKNYFVRVSAETKNPHIMRIWEHGYTLKIMNSLDSKDTEYVEGQHQLMYYLDKQGIKVPIPVENIRGETFSVESFGSRGHVVRLLTYHPGNVLGRIEPTPELLFNVGKFVGNLSNCLKNFKNPSYEKRRSIWMLEYVLSIRKFLNVIKDENRLQLVCDTLQQFEDQVLTNLNKLERGTIHGDVNEHNIIVLNDNVEALLDFGDSHNSAIIFELAICMCYMFIQCNDIGVGKSIIQGYLQHRQLSLLEKEVLKTSICGRLCQSLVLGLYSHQQDLENNYILGSQKNGWRILRMLHDLNEEQIFDYWGLN